MHRHARSAPDRAHAHRPARPRPPPGRAHDRDLRPYGRRSGGDREAGPRLPAGRAGVRGAAARRAEVPGLDRARAAGLPGADARPARHRPLDARRDARWEGAPEQYEYLSTSAPTRSCATPRRSARRSASTAGACSARASAASAWRPISRSPRGAREALISGGLPPLRTPSTTSIATRTRRARAHPPLLRALPRRPRGMRGSHDERKRRRASPVRRPLTWRRVRQLAMPLGMSDGADGSTTCSISRSTRPRSSTTSQARRGSGATRCTRSCTRPVTPTAA